MQIYSNNYNVLGKVGPHYERPEYRPPDQTTTGGDGKSQAVEQRDDRRTLSTKNTDVAAKKAMAQPTGRLNLSAAQNLVEETADMILSLPPQSTTHEPHTKVPSSLMRPVYA